ncbi:MAG: MFS transporter, partial [Nitriliruptor sp.]
ATDAGLEAEVIDALVEDYKAAQLFALKSGLLACVLLALLAFPATRQLPADRPTRPASQEAP